MSLNRSTIFWTSQCQRHHSLQTTNALPFLHYARDSRRANAPVSDRARVCAVPSQPVVSTSCVSYLLFPFSCLFPWDWLDNAITFSARTRLGATAVSEGPDVRQLPRVFAILEATGIRQVYCVSHANLPPPAHPVSAVSFPLPIHSVPRHTHHQLSPRTPLSRPSPASHIPWRVKQPGSRVARAQDTVLPLDVLSEPSTRAVGAGRGGRAAAGGEWTSGDGGHNTEGVKVAV